MENKKIQERVLAFKLATEITIEEMEQVSGGGLTSSGTRKQTQKTSMGGRDQTIDSDND